MCVWPFCVFVCLLPALFSTILETSTRGPGWVENLSIKPGVETACFTSPGSVYWAHNSMRLWGAGCQTFSAWVLKSFGKNLESSMQSCVFLDWFNWQAAKSCLCSFQGLFPCYNLLMIWSLPSLEAMVFLPRLVVFKFKIPLWSMLHPLALPSRTPCLGLPLIQLSSRLQKCIRKRTYLTPNLPLLVFSPPFTT